MEGLSALTKYGLICGSIAVSIAFAAGILWYAYSAKRTKSQLLTNEKNERNSRKLAIYESGGILAPAVILSARRVRSWRGVGSGVGKTSKPPYHLVDFEAEVKPDGGVPFRVKFSDQVVRREYSDFSPELPSEQGQKIWVVYDPKDTSRAYLDHYDTDHESAMKERETDIRRYQFNQLTEGNDALKANGIPAEAVIARVDDLNLPYPWKKARAMHIYFDVMPKNGFTFQSEGDFLIGDGAGEKYSVGKKIYVRYDQQNPKRVALDSAQNKNLP